MVRLRQTRVFGGESLDEADTIDPDPQELPDAQADAQGTDADDIEGTDTGPDPDADTEAQLISDEFVDLLLLPDPAIIPYPANARDGPSFSTNVR